MERREFLGSALAASALATVPAALASAADESSSGGREYYQLRRYQILSGPQGKAAADYFRDGLIPALNRLQISPVGVFNVSIGVTTPALYVLMPCLSLETLVKLDEKLAADADYQKAATPFLTASAIQPAYSRMESSLLQAFEKMPRLTLPDAATAKMPRIYELRTYESPSDEDHKRKLEQMQAGEREIFKSVGAWPVFFGDTLIGSRLPNLTYMLGFENLAEREKKWAAFAASPDWKALNSQPRYAYESIVSNITNQILTPAAYSQI